MAISSPLFFYLFAAIAIAFSCFVVFKKNPVSSAFSLVLVFFAFAGIYAVMGAHLIAALQILVYAGAIMVLFIFVIMLLNADQPSLDLKRTGMFVKSIAIASGLGMVTFITVVFKNSDLTIGSTGFYTKEVIDRAGGNARLISELMFSEYILPFELTSVLLLAAIVATVALAKRNAPKGKL